MPNLLICSTMKSEKAENEMELGRIEEVKAGTAVETGAWTPLLNSKLLRHVTAWRKELTPSSQHRAPATHSGMENGFDTAF